MPQFQLSYSSSSLEHSIDLMDVTNFFVTAHSFKRSQTSTGATLDLILTVQAETTSSLSDKLAYVSQLIQDAAKSSPPDNAGPPLLLWAKFGDEGPWTIWTITKGITAPMDLGTAHGLVYQLHLQLTILPHTLGLAYTIDALTVATNQTVFIAHVPGSEPAATRITLTNFPPSLHKLYMGLRGHKNLMPGAFDPHYPVLGTVTTSHTFQSLCRVNGRNGSFDNGLFDVFLHISDGAPYFSPVSDLNFSIGPGALSGDFFEYLVTGVDYLGNEGLQSNRADVELASAPLIFFNTLEMNVGERLASGGRVANAFTFAVDPPAFPSPTSGGLSFALQSDGWTMQEQEQSLLVMPGSSFYGNTQPTNKLPPKAGELGYTSSLLRIPLPTSLAKRRSLTFSFNLTALQLGGLSSPVFFPLLGTFGLSFDGQRWCCYSAPDVDPVTAWKANKLISSALKAPVPFGPSLVAMSLDWTLGFTAVQLFVDGQASASLVAKGEPKSTDVALGAYLTNALPAYTFVKQLNTDEASWSYTRVARQSLNDTTAASLASSKSISEAIASNESESAGKSNNDSTSISVNSSVGSSGDDSTSQSTIQGKAFSVNSGFGSTESDATSTHTVQFDKYPITAQYVAGVGEAGIILGQDLFVDFGVPSPRLEFWDGSPPGKEDPFFGGFEGYAGPSQTISSNDSAHVSLGGNSTASSAANSSASNSAGGSNSGGGAAGDGRGASTSSALGTQTSSGSSGSASNGSGNSSSTSSSTSHSQSAPDRLDFDIPKSSFSRNVTYVATVVTKVVSQTQDVSIAQTASSNSTTTSSNSATSSGTSSQGKSDERADSGTSTHSTSGSFATSTGDNSVNTGAKSVQDDSIESVDKGGTNTTKVPAIDKAVGPLSLHINAGSMPEDLVAPIIPFRQGGFGESLAQFETPLFITATAPPDGYESAFYYVETFNLFQVALGFATPIPDGWTSFNATLVDESTGERTPVVVAKSPPTGFSGALGLGTIWWNGINGAGAKFVGGPETVHTTLQGSTSASSNAANSGSGNSSSALSSQQTESLGAFSSEVGKQQNNDTDATNNSTGSSSNSSSGDNTNTSSGAAGNGSVGAGTNASNSSADSTTEASGSSSANQSATNNSSGNSKTVSVTYEDIYLIKPLIDTIIPDWSTPLPLASIEFSATNLSVYDGPIPTQEFAISFTWTPTSNLAKQRLYRNTEDVWAYLELGPDVATFTDDGTLTWIEGEPPSFSTLVQASGLKLRINGTIDTESKLSHVGYGSPHFVVFGPVALSPSPNTEPEDINGHWFFDVLGSNTTGAFPLSITDCFIVPHQQGRIHAIGTSDSWTLETNRHGQTGGTSALDISGQVNFSPGSNVLVLLGEDNTGAPISLEGATVTATISPQTEWTQALE